MTADAGKTFHVIRGRVVCIVILSFQSTIDLLCFVDDLCQILGMFSLNSIGCVTSAVLLAILSNRQMYVKGQRAQIFIQKDLSNILTAR